MNKFYFVKTVIVIFFLTTLMSFGCKKKNNLCENTTSLGRIIGYDPCLNYKNRNSVNGTGFVIEMEAGATKDTTVTYDIVDGLFNFLSSYIDEGYSSYLFRPEIQDKFKIKFKFRIASDNEKTHVPCNASVWTAPFNSAVKGKEIVMTCTSPQ